MFKLAIKVCFKNCFELIHSLYIPITLSLGSTKSVYFFGTQGTNPIIVLSFVRQRVERWSSNFFVFGVMLTQNYTLMTSEENCANPHDHPLHRNNKSE